MGEVPPVREATAEPRAIDNSAKTSARWRTPSPSVLGFALVGLLLLPACGSGGLTEEERPAAEIQIYAAVTRQLVEIDNTFGPHHRFTRILIVDYLDPYAGDAMNSRQTERLLSNEQRRAIIAAIEHLGPVEFVSNPDAFVREDVLEPVIPGSVIVTLAPADFDGEGATVGANLWCGGTCGLWLTYRVGEGPDGWTVGGREGTWSIS